MTTSGAHGFRYDRPPGPRANIPYAFSLRFLRDPLTVLNDLAVKYGDISYFKFGRQGIYFVKHPDHIQSVLVTNQSKFIKNPGLRLTKRIIGDGLLTSEGEYHKRQRNLIQPAFDYKHIGIYADVITSCGEDLCKEWISDNSEQGTTIKVIDVHKEMTKLTMSIISRLLFGSTIDSDMTGRIIQDVSILVGYFNHLRLPFIGNIIEKLPLASSRQFHAAKRHLDSLILEIIADSKQKLKDTSSNDLDSHFTKDFRGGDRNNPPDLLSTLLLLDLKRTGSDKTGAVAMTDRQLKDEIMTLFLAGHETTANALTWTLYLISQNLGVESKIIAEIKQVLENERPPTMEDIERFQYLRNVFAESLRLYPPAWAIGREAIDNIVIGNYSIPRGSVVVMSQYITHRDPRFFSEPNKFIPELHRSGMKINLHKFAFFPFGGGSRICMGEPLAWMEGILLLVTILRHWKMDLLPEHPVALSPLITLRPKYGIKMIIKPRTNNL
ncbi:MAG TPA: cytochrome P450 [Nitrososphaeraceae archaeon]|nr:cytochrome P450 [Nitrososphaeraceae archaeon]